MNQITLAKKARIHQPTLSKILSGRYAPQLESFIKICKALDITADDVIYIKDLNRQRIWLRWVGDELCSGALIPMVNTIRPPNFNKWKEFIEVRKNKS